MRNFAVVLLLAALTLLAGVTGEPCDPSTCDSATCRCSSTTTPGELDPSDIPHFVVISFDAAVTVTNYPFYEMLQERVNPNGCPIEMTFFVSHENTNYTLTHELYRHGHDIAINSVSHKPDVENYWRVLDVDGWKAEIEDQITMVNEYANIPREEIKGFRAPFLEVGGDSMYQALEESDLEYDCSWPSLHYTPWYSSETTDPLGALWPYTLDYDSVQDISVGTKPNGSYPGFWVAPMTDLRDFRGVQCAMLDACQGEQDELLTSAEAVSDLLKNNFHNHLNARTPFGIYTHHSWFATNNELTDTIRKEGFEDFLNYLKAFPFVYIVSVQQLVEWVKNPTSFGEIGDNEAFQCSQSLPQSECDAPYNCEYKDMPLPIEPLEVVMNTCDGVCPPYYPYLGNTDGRTPYSED